MLKSNKLVFIYFFNFNFICFLDWGLGIGDWGFNYDNQKKIVFNKFYYIIS